MQTSLQKLAAQAWFRVQSPTLCVLCTRRTRLLVLTNGLNVGEGQEICGGSYHWYECNIRGSVQSTSVSLQHHYILRFPIPKIDMGDRRSWARIYICGNDTALCLLGAMPSIMGDMPSFRGEAQQAPSTFRNGS